NRTDALAGRDARTRASRGEDNGAGAGAAGHLVRDGASAEVDLHQVLARILGRLFHGRRHFVGLAVADADIALAVAGDDQRAKAEGAAALDDLGAAIDADDGRFQAALFLARTAVTAIAASWAATAVATALLRLARLGPGFGCCLGLLAGRLLSG